MTTFSISSEVTAVQIAEAKVRMGKQLFPGRLLTGEQDIESDRFLAEADQMLSQRSDYVGVSLCGSRLKGYATPESDFDVLLIAGNSMVDTENQLAAQFRQLPAMQGKTRLSIKI